MRRTGAGGVPDPCTLLSALALLLLLAVAGVVVVVGVLNENRKSCTNDALHSLPKYASNSPTAGSFNALVGSWVYV